MSDKLVGFSFVQNSTLFSLDWSEGCSLPVWVHFDWPYIYLSSIFCLPFPTLSTLSCMPGSKDIHHWVFPFGFWTVWATESLAANCGHLVSSCLSPCRSASGWLSSLNWMLDLFLSGECSFSHFGWRMETALSYCTASLSWLYSSANTFVDSPFVKFSTNYANLSIPSVSWQNPDWCRWSLNSQRIRIQWNKSNRIWLNMIQSVFLWLIWALEMLSDNHQIRQEL